MAVDIKKCSDHIEKYLLVDGKHLDPLSRGKKLKLRSLLRLGDKTFATNKGMVDGIPFTLILHKELRRILGINFFAEVKLEEPIPEEYFKTE